MNYTLTEPGLLKKIAKKDQERRLVAQHRTEHLSKWLKQNDFLMNKEAALGYLDGSYKDNSKSYHKRLDFILNFENYLIKYSREGDDDRFHSIFTRMPSDLKQFVRFGDKKIVEVDITNSQPLFLVLLLEEIRSIHQDHIQSSLSFKELKKRIKHTLSSYINNSNKDSYYNISKYKIDTNRLSNNISTILSKSLETLDFTDVLLFKKLVIEGVIYEHIEKVLLESNAVWKKDEQYFTKLYNKGKGIQEENSFSTPRKCVKTVMLNALYSPPNTKGLKAINDLKKEFPSLFTIIDAIKGKQSTDFPIYLQRMEAKFILDICSKRIHKQNPKLLLISRHDSLSTTEKHSKHLQCIMQEMLKNYLEFPVKLKREAW
ncbi:hypothetical protein NE848_05870 [Gramella jeungdoensis]|uniref:Uncharacterized protein n=1 Tax=Gramella jeungdoensis TaxID=708091 RepID=A0ABT0YZJ6_9FLAO|nr:hypothetical protein [Gramella jeungdoensis]MCM8568895.1 hypothetical protein [Gramella jeungdoensis]